MISNRITLGLGILFLCTICSSSFGFSELNPYIGFEYKYQNMSGKDDWGKLVPKDFHNTGIFFGTLLNPNVGLEFGYSHSNNKARDRTFNSGATLFNSLVTNRFTETTKVRLNHYNLDTLGYYEVLDGLSFVGSLGLALIKPKIFIASTDSNTQVNALKTVNGKWKGTGRVGMGLQYKEKFFGIRALLRWELTNKLQANADTVKATFIQATSKPYKDSYSAACSVFFSF